MFNAPICATVEVINLNNDCPQPPKFLSYMDSNPHRSEFLAPSSWFTDASHYIAALRPNKSVIALTSCVFLILVLG